MTQERLKILLDYDPETGVFTGKTIRGKHDRRGVIEGSNRTAGGYCRLLLDGKQYLAHRMAWLYVYGFLPEGIDHRNTNTSDNRISNLRVADKSQNGANMPARNPGRLKGAYFNKAARRWQSQIMHNYKQYYLGLYDSEKEAHKAYVEAAINIYGEFARAA